MKALLINGSPRAKGCTHGALKIVEEQLLQAGIGVRAGHVHHKRQHTCRYHGRF